MTMTADMRVLISRFGGFFEFQRLIAGIAGAQINAVFVLRIETEGGFSAVLHTPSVLPLVFTVGRQYGAAAVKHAAGRSEFIYAGFSVRGLDTFCVVPKLRRALPQFDKARTAFTVGTGSADTEYAGVIRASVSNAAVIARFNTPRRIGQFRLALAEINKVQSCFPAEAAACRRYRAADPVRIVHAPSLCAADQLDKSFSVAAIDRKYFPGPVLKCR